VLHQRRRQHDASNQNEERDEESCDGKTVLPHHIHWYAHAPSVKIRQADFLIDGKLRWVQHAPPYI